MKDVSAYRPRHWLVLIAGLSFVVIRVLEYYEYPLITMPDLWSKIFLPAAFILVVLAMGVSLIVYCVQWVVTLISVIMARRRSANT